MTEEEKYFQCWYIDALKPLRDSGSAGFIFALVSFPLLERYLREKCGIGEGPLTDRFYTEFDRMFPDTAGRSKDLWQCYRNGLLHQAAFSKEGRRAGFLLPMPRAGLSGYDPRPVYFDSASECFYMNPVAFFDKVTKTILSDFKTFLAPRSPAHRLSVPWSPDTALPHVVPTIGPPIPRDAQDGLPL